MKRFLISGTSNQISSTEEIMPDLNHSGIYNTKNGQQTLCVRIYIQESCGARMSDNEHSQQREEKENIDLKEKNTQAN